MSRGPESEGWIREAGREPQVRLAAAAGCLVAVVGLLVLDAARNNGGDGELATTGLEVATTTTASTTPPTAADGSPAELTVATSIPAAPDLTVGGLLVDTRSSQRPWSDLGAIPGLLTFRGNPTRSYHGRGPVPDDPEILWSRTIGCSNSPVGGESKVWCGTGWTGQPAVFPAPDGAGWWVGVGGYNRNVNFFDPTTGDEAMPPFPTGDIIKGTITVDPDGFPLLYTGSRDNFLHVAAIDGDEPRELWRLSATEHQPTLWNNDWDSSPIVVSGHLFIGGENSRFYAIELNRGFGPDGRVTVDPEVVFTAEGWDAELLADLGDRQVSIENSVAMAGSVVYFANSGGLVQGWDVGGLREGREPERVFRYWIGDDTDATVVIDDDGMLYAVSQFERGNARSRELGQIVKLDPSVGDGGDPLVWSREASSGLNTGVWATPALWRDLVIVSTDDGRVLGLDRVSGDERWLLELTGPLWSSPSVVDGVLIQGDCDGTLHAFDLGDGSAAPEERWSVDLGGCIESTPAVWDGRIFVGTRTGDFYAIGDR
ncbi:MAG: PQQ-binding-like beta-propeller repeat protein [Actinomycetota bacterium]